MRLTVRHRLAVGFAFLLALLGLNAGVSSWNTRRLIENNRRVTHTYEVINELNALRSTIHEADTGTRGYVLTGQEAYLEPFTAAEERMKERLASLNGLLYDNPAQHARVPALADHIGARLAAARRTIRTRRERGFRAAQRLIEAGVGKAEMDAIRQAIAVMQAEERRLLAARAHQSGVSAITATFTIGLAATLNLLLLLYVWSLLARAEVQRERLDKAYADLQRAESMRDGLTAMLVHDLRTPLTTMLGSLDMLRDETAEPIPPDLQREMIDMSAQGGYRLLGLVNELLDVSKMEAGEMKLRLDTVQAGVTVDEAVKQVSRLDLGDKERVARDIAPDLPLLQADSELLIRVLINLLGNALKFTPRGGLVTVGARLVHPLREGLRPAVIPTRDAPGGDPRPAVLFSVRDTGEGIPKEDQGRIFEKFGQVESRKAGRKMSSGLGLTFCKLAVEAHGGRIWVESEMGRGSVFRFTIPLRGQEPPRDGAQDIRAEAAAQ